jgi:O-antigen/teichoic acid export membrane protein
MVGTATRIDSNVTSTALAFIQKPVLIASFDQAVVSATNLLIRLYVAHRGTAQAFGAYGLSFLILDTAAIFNRAAIWQPMSVLSGTRDHSALDATYWSTYLMSWTYALILGVSFFVPSLVLWSSGYVSANVLIAGVAIALASVVATVHEMQRRINFCLGKTAVVLQSDLASLMTVLLVLGMAFPATVLSARSVATTGLIALTAGTAVAAISGAQPVMALWRVSPRPQTRSVIRSHWPIAKWNLLANILLASSDRVAIFILSGYAGLTATAQLEAGRVMAMPFGVVLVGAASHLLPVIAQRARKYGTQNAARYLSKWRRMLLIGGLAYGAVVFLCAGRLESLLFGHNYGNVGLTGSAWSIVWTCNAVATLQAPLLVFLDCSSWIAISHVPGFVIMALVVIPAVSRFGSAGVAMMMAVSGCLSCIVMAARIKRALQEVETASAGLAEMR